MFINEQKNGGKKMKRTFFLILLLSFTFSSSHLFAGNEIITSKTLSIDDVKNYIQ